MLAKENEEAWFFFCSVSTQVRSVGMGAISGIDYGSLEFVFNCYGVPMWRRAPLLEDIRILESVAIRIWNEAGNKTQPRPNTDPRRG